MVARNENGKRIHRKNPVRYRITKKIAIVRRFRNWKASLDEAAGKPLSPNLVREIMADLCEQLARNRDDWEQGQSEAVFLFGGSLDAHTVRKLLTCELDLTAHSLQARTLGIVEGFLNLVREYPLDYFPKGFGTEHAIDKWKLDLRDLS